MRGLATLAILALGPVSAADWVRLRAPGVEVVTDAGERTGRRVLARLEQIRQIFPSASRKWQRALRVAVFASEREFRGFSPSATADGFYQSGWERDYILTHGSAGLSRVVVHEYIHFLIHQEVRRLPNWFEEGLAEFYSNVEVGRDWVRVGEPIDTHVGLLKRGNWLDARGLVSPPPGVVEGTGRAAELYYAQSWALAHMLNLADAYRDGMPRFAALLADGRDDSSAFREAFDRGMDEALADLRAYVAKGMRAVRVNAPALAEPLASETEAFGDAQALLLRGELALRCGRPDTAGPLFERAAREHPGDALAIAGLGTLALARGEEDLARKHLEASLALDGNHAATWYQYAMLERDADARPERVAELLGRVIALNPDFGEAHVLLGVRATDDGDLPRAVEHLRRAVRLLPRKSYVWHALAYAEDKLGDTGPAILSARQAVRTAVNQQQASMAEALLDSLLRAANAAPAR